MESRLAPILCFDVLMQYCCTLAISEGFYADALLHEIRHTHCFAQISDEEWEKMLQFLTKGGVALQQYDDYHKMIVTEGRFHISSRSIAMRHRLNIGTIVSDAMLQVKFIGGKQIGVIEEWFVSRLLPGEVFTLAGRNLEFVQIREMTVMVRKSNATKSIVPSWMGGRMPMSSSLGKMLRKKLDDASRKISLSDEPEMLALIPLLEQQRKSSVLPAADELLIEHISTKDGYHLFVYPFEGRLVHEAMAAILAYRLSKKKRISFSFAMNDYGFELLSDQPIDVNNENAYALFSEVGLFNDILSSINASEMASRKFRDIAVIGGLLFQGMPGEKVKQKHLQSSSSLLFRVFSQYEPDNLLLRQAYQEVMEQQMDEPRLRDMLQRIQKSKIIITHPTELTPFCFPIKVDSIREKITSETLEDQIRKLRPV
jgi:ATP-dependent Lhr-like helicase